MILYLNKTKVKKEKRDPNIINKVITVIKSFKCNF